MSAQLGKRKARNVIATGAEIVATANPGCAMQLDFALRQISNDESQADGAAQGQSGRTVKVRYVVDLLDAAYALE